MIRHQTLYAIKREGLFHIRTKVQLKAPTQSKDINQLSILLTDPRSCEFVQKSKAYGEKLISKRHML